MVTTVPGITSYPTQPETVPINIGQCVREVYALMLSSLRDRDRTIQIWRDLENRMQDEVTSEKAKSLRNILPQILRVSTMVLSGVGVLGGLFPQAIKHSYDWITCKCPSIHSSSIDEMFAKGATDAFLKLSKDFTKKLDMIQGVFKTGIELHKANAEAYQFELDALIDKSKRVEERRKEEARERQSSTDEVQRLLQQINNHIAEAIRALAR
jgi:hypothetical protein